MPMTLDELKAENAKTEQEAAEQTASETAESEVKAEEEVLEETDTVAEQDSEETETETLEAWMQADDAESSSDSEHLTNSDAAAIRRKWKGKLSEAKDENEALKAEIEKLKTAQTQGQQPSVKTEPKFEDFDYDEVAYNKARDEWLLSQVDARISAQAQTQAKTAQQRQQEAEKNRLLDEHYQRAEKLARESNISAENYQASDRDVRLTVSSVNHFSKNADEVTDHLITALGDGSEKVMYYLGRNPKAQLALKDALEKDPSGAKAGVYLGTLKAQITQPVKKTSNASKPAAKASGENQSSGVSNFKRQYDKAKTTQERYQIKREARKAGEDTREWY